MHEVACRDGMCPDMFVVQDTPWYAAQRVEHTKQYGNQCIEYVHFQSVYTLMVSHVVVYNCLNSMYMYIYIYIYTYMCYMSRAAAPRFGQLTDDVLGAHAGDLGDKLELEPGTLV